MGCVLEVCSTILEMPADEPELGAALDPPLVLDPPPDPMLPILMLPLPVDGPALVPPDALANDVANSMVSSDVMTAIVATKPTFRNDRWSLLMVPYLLFDAPSQHAVYDENTWLGRMCHDYFPLKS